MSRRVRKDIDQALGDSRLWEGRSKAAKRFELSVSQFAATMGDLLESRYRKVEERKVLYFIPALWVFYAVDVNGMDEDEYRVDKSMLDYLRYGEKGMQEKYGRQAGKSARSPRPNKRSGATAAHESRNGQTIEGSSI